FSFTTPTGITGDTTSGSATINNVSDTSKLVFGMVVTGTGIPGTTTTITAISGNTITLSAAATATNTGVALTFPNPASGNVGLADKHGKAIYGNAANVVNFEVDALAAPGLPFTDNFHRSLLSGLGDPWSVDQGGFNITGNQAVAAAQTSEATLYGVSISTVDESVTIVTQGTSAGLLARWNSATQTGYEVLLTGTSLKLFSVQR